MSQEQAPSSRIADKIAKLLKLANGNTTEAEASAAMEKVQELLANYNLTMADIEAHGGKTADDGKREKVKHEKSAMYEYQRNLMKVVAEVHFCIYFASEKSTWSDKGQRWTRKKVHNIIGREVNVISARQMFDYLNGTIDKLANAVYPPPTNLCKSAVSWKEGCAARLQERLRTRAYEANQRQRQEAEAAQKRAAAASPTATTTALVLLTDIRQMEDDLNRDFHYGLEPGTTALRRAQYAAMPVEPVKEWVDTRTDKEKERDRKANEKYWERQQRNEERKWANKDMSAYRAGQQKGDTIGLDPQVGHSESKKLK